MSGGIMPGRGRTLAERSARSVPPSQPALERRGAGARHCWVLDPPEATGKWPGLLSEWRRSEEDRWQGRTVYAVTVAGRTVLVEDWVDAARLHEA